VKNEKLLKRIIKENVLTDSHAEAMVYEQHELDFVDKKIIRKYKESPFQFLAFDTGKNVELYAHVNSRHSVKLPKRVIKNKKIFAYRVGNNEHDDYFMRCESDSSCPVSSDCTICLENGLERAKNIDFYFGDQKKVLELFTIDNQILENQVFEIGADRNG
jgi:hypothetical protein